MACKGSVSQLSHCSISLGHGVLHQLIPGMHNSSVWPRHQGIPQRISSGPGGILFWVGQAPLPWDAGSCFSLGTGMCDHSGGPMHHFLGCMALLQLRHWGGMIALSVQGTVFPKRRILLQLPSKSVRERIGGVAPSLLGSSRTEPTAAPSSA